MPRRGTPGDVAMLQRVLWRTILQVEALLDVRPYAPELVLKAAHALAQLAGPYTRLLETADLEARLTALEQRLSAEYSHNGTPP